MRCSVASLPPAKSSVPTKLAQVRKRAVEQHEGRALIVNVHEALEHLLTGGDRRRIDAAGEHHSNLRLLDFWVVLGGGQDEAVGLTAQCAAQGLGQFSEEGVEEVRER